ncbi:aldehyde ferredoxin oxidoreductase N-terminal domain-containing protein, partial [Alloalcanivorax venustensis]|uniref:aldehyde ferredoxin oxidoreductase N-terminal domain-containing protein n=1 Tax=Alloalcanivorax venustensis TaxID=172371 RepID=UPI00355A21FD
MRVHFRGAAGQVQHLHAAPVQHLDDLLNGLALHHFGARERAPSSGRTTVTCKSPATGLYLKTSAGGKWGAALKFAGYDSLVVHGRASSPVTID